MVANAWESPRKFHKNTPRIFALGTGRALRLPGLCKGKCRAADENPAIGIRGFAELSRAGIGFESGLSGVNLMSP
jgi:hypothetical protein